VKEDKDKIIFLYKVKPGGTNKSYGIQVARLAGVPIEIIDRAKIILAKIESENLARMNGLEEKIKGGTAIEIATNDNELIGANFEIEKSSRAIEEINPGSGGRVQLTGNTVDSQRSTNVNDREKQSISNKQWQLKLFSSAPDNSPLLDELKNIDVKNITPVQALNKLYELQKKADKVLDEDQDDAELVKSKKEH